jgi:hypothetical protein
MLPVSLPVSQLLHMLPVSLLRRMLPVSLPVYRSCRMLFRKLRMLLQKLFCSIRINLKVPWY